MPQSNVLIAFPDPLHPDFTLLRQRQPDTFVSCISQYLASTYEVVIRGANFWPNNSIGHAKLQARMAASFSQLPNQCPMRSLIGVPNAGRWCGRYQMLLIGYDSLPSIFLLSCFLFFFKTIR